MGFLRKIQNQPEHIRKIILWSLVVIFGLGLATWWVKNFQQKIKSFEKEEFIEELKIPSLKEELKGLPEIEIPKIEIPEISEEELKKLEETIKEKYEE